MPTAPVGWKQSGRKLGRTFHFANYDDLRTFVDAVTLAADALGHHPSLAIGENFVAVTIWSRDNEGRVPSALDYALAEKIAAIPGMATRMSALARAVFRSAVISDPALRADWDEGQHPRGPSGRFGGSDAEKDADTATVAAHAASERASTGNDARAHDAAGDAHERANIAHWDAAQAARTSGNAVGAVAHEKLAAEHGKAADYHHGLAERLEQFGSADRG